jgi:hypothetical protein
MSTAPRSAAGAARSGPDVDRRPDSEALNRVPSSVVRVTATSIRSPGTGTASS